MDAPDVTTTTAVAARATVRSGVRVKWNMQRNWPIYVMILPAVVILFVFHYMPMYGIIMAFQDFKPFLGYAESPWVGFLNYQKLFAKSDFWEILRNTVVIAVGKIVVGRVVSVIFALLLNEVAHTFYKRLIQTMSYLLHFLSWIIFGGILITILGWFGLLNRALALVGIEPILWLGTPSIFPVTVILTDTWKEFGWSAVVLLAALTGIDPTLYEAAAVDGANRWQRAWNVTLPGIMPTIVMLTCLSLGSVLNAGFEQLLTLQNPMVLSTGDILDTYVYRAGLLERKYSLGAAVGLAKSVVGFALVMASWWLAGKLANYRIL